MPPSFEGLYEILQLLQLLPKLSNLTGQLFFFHSVTFQLKCLDFEYVRNLSQSSIVLAMGYEVDYFRSDFRTAYFFVMFE